MKICFVIEHLVNGTGGGERVLRDLAGALAARGHEVEVVHFDESGGTPFYSFAPEIRITNLHPRTRYLAAATRSVNVLHRFGLTRTVMASRLAWRLIRRPLHAPLERHLDKARPDVAIAFMPNAIGFLGAVRPRTPLVRIASTHNTPLKELALQPGEHFPYLRMFNLRMLKRFERIVVLMPEFRDWHEPGLRERVRVIPNSIAEPPAPHRPWKERERKVISVGRLVPQKRHALLLDAWAKVTPYAPGWRLEIYGAGPLEEELRKRIAELGIEGTATLRGVTQDIETIYTDARLMAHPAEYEGFGLVIGEALARGVPVIGFDDCPGLNTLVQEGRNGVLLPSEGDRTEVLGEALRALLNEEAELERLAEGAPSSVDAYSLQAMADRWEELLWEIRKPDQVAAE